MLKKNVTYVAAEKFESLILASGLEAEAQAGFVKVKGKVKGVNIYVARTKRVARVDISGFTVEMPGVRTLDEDEAHGSVAQGLDFTGTEDEILAAFADLLDYMSRVDVKEYVRKLPARKATEAKGWSIFVK